MNTEHEKEDETHSSTIVDFCLLSPHIIIVGQNREHADQVFNSEARVCATGHLADLEFEVGDIQTRTVHQEEEHEVLFETLRFEGCV